MLFISNFITWKLNVSSPHTVFPKLNSFNVMLPPICDSINEVSCSLISVQEKAKNGEVL